MEDSGMRSSGEISYNLYKESKDPMVQLVTDDDLYNLNIYYRRELDFKIDLYKKYFSLDKLVECQQMYISPYIKKYGRKPPFHYDIAWVDRPGNFVSYFLKPFFRTNQEYADRVDTAIEKAKLIIKSMQSDPDNNSSDSTHEVIINALADIHKIYSEMFNKKIFGDVRKAIEKIFFKFNIELFEFDFYDKKIKLEELNSLIKNHHKLKLKKDLEFKPDPALTKFPFENQTSEIDQLIEHIKKDRTQTKQRIPSPRTEMFDSYKIRSSF